MRSGRRHEERFGGPFGPHGGRGHGHPGRPWEGRVRRGDMHGLLLAGLLDGPAHGYELMQRLEERTGGQWRPSPGSVYPMLQQLEDEGLARSTDADGRKVYELTDAGREQADEAVLDNFAAGTENASATRQLMTEFKQLALASKQVAMTGDPQVAEQAVAIVKGARQALYRLLAEQ